MLVSGYGFGWVLKTDVLGVSEESIELPLTPSLTCFDCECQFVKRTTQLLFAANGVCLEVAIHPDRPGYTQDVPSLCEQPRPRYRRNVASTCSRLQYTAKSLVAVLTRPENILESLPRRVEATCLRCSDEVAPTSCAKLKSLRLGSTEHKNEANRTVRSLVRMLRVDKTLEQVVLSFDYRGVFTSDNESLLFAFDGEDLTPCLPLQQRMASSASCAHTRRRLRGDRADS